MALQGSGERSALVRLAWIAYSADPRVASFRYRCLTPAWALRHFGHQSAFFDNEAPDPGQFDALIVVKLANDRLGAVARSFQARGKPVFLDLCDNIFIPGYTQRRGPELSRQTASGLVRHADAVVTPTTALARVVRHHLDTGPGSVVVPDAALTPDSYQAMSAWLRDRIAAHPARRKHRWTAGWRRVLAAGRDGAQSPSLSTRAGLDGREGDSFGVDSDWQADHLPKDTARVVWFGRHGSFHSEFGMGLLRPLLPELERVHRERPVELVVISNNRDRFEALTFGARFFTRYQDWSNERVFFELSRAHLFVMPSATDSFSLCKSANRAVLALANGVPVVASYLESLEPLSDALVMDDWRGGIESYLLQDGAREAHLARARQVLARHFSVEAIGRQWHTILERAGRPMALAAGGMA